MFANLTMSGEKISLMNFVNEVIKFEDNLHLQIELDQEKVLNLQSKKIDLKSKLEEETNNFREDVLSNHILYINILEANNLDMNGEIFVKIFCGSQIFTTQVIKNSYNPIWNESYKM